MKYKKKDKVRIIGYNLDNSEAMIKQLEERFPIGSECVVQDITREINKKRRAILKSDATYCNATCIDFCKAMSEKQCLSIKRGEHITHICYVAIEKIE